MPPFGNASSNLLVAQPSQTTLNGQTVANSRDPVEQPKSFVVKVNLATDLPKTIDFTEQLQAGRVSNIQTVFVDNSVNDNALTLTVQGSTQPVVIPANAQAYIPIIAPQPCVFVVTSNGTTGTITLIFLNVPMPFAQWFPFDPHASGSTATASGTDHSANAPALAANLLLTFPINLSRAGYFIQNQSADDVQVVFDDGSGAGTTVLILAAGSAGNKQGASVTYSGMPHKGRIRVFGPNAADQVGGREW